MSGIYMGVRCSNQWIKSPPEVPKNRKEIALGFHNQGITSIADTSVYHATSQLTLSLDIT